MSTPPATTTKVPCAYCGNNPVIHTAAWIDSLILLTLNRRLYWLLGTWVGTLLIFVTETLFSMVRFVLISTGAAHFTADHSLITSGRGEVMAEEARRRGWKFEAFVAFGRLHDAYRLTLPSGKRIFFSGVPRLSTTDVAISGWMDDKALLKKRLSDAGCVVSRGASFIRLKPAQKMFAALQKPVIIKPRFGSRGRHTTTHIHTLEEFNRAFAVAKELCVSVIVEEHLVGSVYRATMIDGKLAGVLAGEPPRITGNGSNTICQLIEQKNNTRPERVGAFKIRDNTIPYLARLGYTLDSVLPMATTIDLTEKIGLSYGGSSLEVTPQTHPKLRAELERASAAVSDPIHGFDFITSDVSVDPDTVRWGIIECNSVPFINLHHDPLIGTPVNAAGILFDYIERELEHRT